MYPVKQTFFQGEDDLIPDPHFRDIQPNLSRADFRLAKGSPGSDRGAQEHEQAIGHADQPNSAQK
jgi:hypothetical protein